MNIYNLIFSIVLLVCVYKLSKYLIEEIITPYLLSYRSSGVYDFDKDKILLIDMIKMMVSKHIQIHVLGGRRLESIRVNKIVIEYDDAVTAKHISEICILVKGVLSPVYTERLQSLYIDKLDEYIELVVKEAYISVTNEFIDTKMKYANQRIKDLKDDSNAKLQDALETILQQVESENELYNIITSYESTKPNRLQHLLVNGTSEYTRSGVAVFIQLQTLVSKMNISLEAVKSELLKRIQ